jgi:hypothetical protein
MKKKEWLQRKVFVDIYGRPPNLSDVPMTYMTFEESLKKRRATKKDIDELWEIEKHTEEVKDG